MGALAARHLRLSGVGDVFVCSRTPAHARQLADEIAGQSVPFEQMSAVLPACDVVVSATSSPSVILTTQMVGAALAGHARPLTIVDLALPRDVEPAVGALERVRLIDLNALQALTAAHLEQRRAEVAPVERIVDEELEAFWRWLRSLSVTPTIVALRERAERIRQSELGDHLGRLQNLSAHDRRVIETMTASIVGRLLHEPTLRLKQRANGADGLQAAATLRELFALDETSTPDGSDDAA
jgi:glutamyl-tRNA reductase